MKYYSMKAKGSEGEILLYQDIGQGGFFSEGTSAEGFAKDLKALGKVSTINCRINSPGGNVFEGMTIYNLLASHQARIVVHVDGLAASIASVIAMAGDEINMADNAMMMIHNAWGIGMGSAEDLRKTADVLDSITGTIGATYTKRTGVKEDKVRAMMDAETWMTAADAKTDGFCDNVVDNMKMAACAFDPRRFKNIPATLSASNDARPRKDEFTVRFAQLETDMIRERLTRQ
jgi:ATP-dependent protease ClpP protease subunit